LKVKNKTINFFKAYLRAVAIVFLLALVFGFLYVNSGPLTSMFVQYITSNHVLILIDLAVFASVAVLIPVIFMFIIKKCKNLIVCISSKEKK